MAKAECKPITIKFILLSLARASLVGRGLGPRQAEELIERELAAGRMPCKCMEGEAPYPEFWRTARVNFEENSAHEFGLPGGPHYEGITVSRAHVLALLPEAQTEHDVGSKEWIPDEVESMMEAGEITSDTRITPLSHELVRRNPTKRTIKARTIENRLRDWGLWPPPTSIK